MSRNKGLVDILMLKNPQTFTVNTAATEVVVNWPALPATSYGEFQNPAGITCFDWQDSPVMLSFAWVLPYCFNISTGTPHVALSWHEPTTAARFPVPEWANGAGLFIPFCNVEIPLDLFVQHTGPPYGSSVKAELFVVSGSINISMIGVPASLNATQQTIQMAMKVLHTIPMIA